VYVFTDIKNTLINKNRYKGGIMKKNELIIIINYYLWQNFKKLKI